MLSPPGPPARKRRHRSRSGTWPGATTELAGVIGDPVDHSLSPTLHNAAFAQLGLDWVYVAFPVPAGRAEPAVAAMVDLGIRGLSVTMPHKAGAARACHRLSPVAQRLGVANTVTNRGGELVGDSTDGPGLIDSLADLGWSPEGKHCLVLGAGGAARAVALSLADSGARQVEVVARQPEQAEAAAALAGRVGTVGSVKSAGAADLVLNATPVGMGGPVDMGGPVGMGGPDGLGGPDGDGRLLPLGLDAGDLGPGQLVADLIYAPATTPLIAAARARGATACNGLGMLIYQAARQLNLWTGREAPVEAMSAAALAELARRAELASRGSLGPEAAPT